MRELKEPVEVDFVDVRSYTGMEKHEPEMGLDTEQEIEGRDVLIVEDIVDTGETINFLEKEISSRNPSTLKICSLLVKSKGREVDVDLDYVGFEIPDVFVVGYGLNVNEDYRRLPDIHYVEETK